MYNCFEIQRYQNVINQGGHPIALVSMVTALREKSLQATHARGAPQAFSFHSSTHSQARLPFTQPTMQLSFKFQSRNLRGLAISLQKLSAGFVTHAASSRTIGRQPAARAGAAFDLFVLQVESIVNSGPTMHLSIAKLAGAGLGAEISLRVRIRERMQALAIDRSRTCAAGFANPLRESHVHACTEYKTWHTPNNRLWSPYGLWPSGAITHSSLLMQLPLSIAMYAKCKKKGTFVTGFIELSFTALQSGQMLSAVQIKSSDSTLEPWSSESCNDWKCETNFVPVFRKQ